MKPGGIVVTVAPGPRHLYQLKALIYPEVQLHGDAQEHLEGFELLSCEKLAYEMKLPGKQSFNLLQMTPLPGEHQSRLGKRWLHGRCLSVKLILSLRCTAAEKILLLKLQP